MSAPGGPWDRREPGPTPDDLPQPDGSCDACEPDEAQPSTQVCSACSFSFCPAHGEQHHRQTRHRLSPYSRQATGAAGGAAAAAEGTAAAAAAEGGVAGLVVNEEEEGKKEGEAVAGAAASRPRDTSKQAEILGMLAAVVEMMIGSRKAPEGLEDAAGGAAASGDPWANQGNAPAGRGPAEGAAEAAAQQGVQPAAQQGAQPAAAPEARVRDSVSVERLRCPLHAQDGTLYCRTDEKIVCVLCAVQGEHSGHEIITLQEAYAWQKTREGPDLLGQTKQMGQRIMSKWSDPTLSTDELQAFVDCQFSQLKSLVCDQERRTRHLVDLKEAFVTATAAEKIAEITVETERLQETMVSISRELGALNRAKMAAEEAAASGAPAPAVQPPVHAVQPPVHAVQPPAEGRRVHPEGRRFHPEGRRVHPRDAEAVPRRPEPRRDPVDRGGGGRGDEDGPRSSMGHAP